MGSSPSALSQPGVRGDSVSATTWFGNAFVRTSRARSWICEVLDAHQRRRALELGRQVLDAAFHERRPNLLERGASTATPSVRETWTASSSPNKFGKRDDRRHDDDAEDQQVFPQRIAVHVR